MVILHIIAGVIIIGGMLAFWAYLLGCCIGAVYVCARAMIRGW